MDISEYDLIQNINCSSNRKPKKDKTS